MTRKRLVMKDSQQSPHHPPSLCWHPSQSRLLSSYNDAVCCVDTSLPPCHTMGLPVCGAKRSQWCLVDKQKHHELMVEVTTDGGSTQSIGRYTQTGTKTKVINIVAINGTASNTA
eukprot:1291391-Rhodomonas_salina.1